MGVAAQQLWPTLGSQFIQELPQTRLRIRRRRLMAPLHFHSQQQAFLPATERLRRRVEIETPVLFRKLFVAAFELSVEPLLASAFVDWLEGPPRGILAHQLVHAPQRRPQRVGESMWAYRRRPASSLSSRVTSTSRLDDALGLTQVSGQSLTQASNSPDVLRNSTKQGNCPKAATPASSSILA